ncbi:MAG: hypothetical protein ABIE43_04580 [Patescibacteria group bacterium]
MYSIKQLLIIIIITAAIFTGVGYYGTSIINNNSPTVVATKESVPSNQDSFQAGWDAARQRLIETGFLKQEKEAIKTISGEVTDVKGNKISLKLVNFFEPLSDPGLDIRIVEADEKTKIDLRSLKDEEQYKNEIEAYEKERQAVEETIKSQGQSGSGEEEPVKPEPFIVKTGSISDIKEGVSITVKADNDIKNVKEFKAVEIVAQQ